MKLTPNLQHALDRAESLAAYVNSREVGIDELFHCFLQDMTPTLVFVSRASQQDLREWFALSANHINRKKGSKKPSSKRSAKLDKFLQECEKLALYLGHDYIGPEIMMATFMLKPYRPKCIQHFDESVFDLVTDASIKISMDDESIHTNVAPSVVTESDISNSDFRSLPMFSSNDILDKFAVNLNLKALKSESAIVDFDNKIDDLATVLCRKQKPNALLVGPAGTGKTSLVQGLADMIVSGEAPSLISSHVIYSLSLSSMVAGTQYRGQFEERMEQFIKEITKYDNVILFIDEIHTLVGAGGTGSQDSLEASNILKPSLADGSLSCIGATTPKEYSNTFQNDSALNRRFAYLSVREPSSSQMQEILPQILSSYSDFHSVDYSEDFARHVIDYCDKFYPNKNYPDKAIDVIDHCGAQAKIDFWETPQELNDLRTECFRLEVMEEAVPNTLHDKLVELEGDWEKKQSSSRPIASEEHIQKFFQNRRPIMSRPKSITSVVSFLSNELVLPSYVMKNFRDSLFSSSLGLDSHSSHLPQIRAIIGDDKSGKSSFVSSLVRALDHLNANVLHYDGSHFSGPTTFSKLYGGPNNGVSLCSFVRDHSDAVILIDNIEKCDDLALNFLKDVSQVGSCQSFYGDKVDFSNVMVFVTSRSKNSKDSLGFCPNAPAKEFAYPEIKLCGTISLESQSKITVSNFLRQKFSESVSKMKASGITVVNYDKFIADFAANHSIDTIDEAKQFFKTDFQTFVLDCIKNQNNKVDFGNFSRIRA